MSEQRRMRRKMKRAIEKQTKAFKLAVANAAKEPQKEYTGTQIHELIDEFTKQAKERYKKPEINEVNPEHQ